MYCNYVQIIALSLSYSFIYYYFASHLVYCSLFVCVFYSIQCFQKHLLMIWSESYSGICLQQRFLMISGNGFVASIHNYTSPMYPYERNWFLCHGGVFSFLLFFVHRWLFFPLYSLPWGHTEQCNIFLRLSFTVSRGTYLQTVQVTEIHVHDRIPPTTCDVVSFQKVTSS